MNTQRNEKTNRKTERLTKGTVQGDNRAAGKGAEEPNISANGKNGHQKISVGSQIILRL
jgi:hypothetical protein